MKRGFLVGAEKKAANTATNQERVMQASADTPKPVNLKHQKFLDLINQCNGLTFEHAQTLPSILFNVDLKDINLNTSVYTVIPKDQELSYEAFNFISSNHKVVKFFYSDNTTLIVLKDFLENDFDGLAKVISIFKNRTDIKLQFPALIEHYAEKLEKITQTDEKIFKATISELLDPTLNLLQIACSLKFPENYQQHKISLLTNSVNEFKQMAIKYDVDINDLDTNAAIEQQYRFLIERFSSSIGIKKEEWESKLRDEDQWDKNVLFIVHLLARNLEFRCVDFDGQNYHQCAAAFLQAVFDRFLLLKKFCNFKAHTYDLYHLFNLDILVNIFFKDLDQSSSLRKEERKILIYIDRYQQNDELNAEKLIFAHMAMLKVAMLKKDYELVNFHFEQFKEIYLKNIKKASNVHSLIFQILPEIIKRICNGCKRAGKLQDTVDIILGFRKILNEAFSYFQSSIFKADVSQFQNIANSLQKLDKNAEITEDSFRIIMLGKFKKEKYELDEYCRKTLQDVLPKIKKIQEEQKSSIIKIDICETATQNAEKISYESSQEEKPQQITTETPLISIEDFANKQTPSDKAETANELEEGTRKNLVSYSENYFLWSSINKKLKIEAKLDMQSCIKAKMTKDEIEAAVRILESARITGAIGDGIKLVANSEKKYHNLHEHVYKIKHVGLNFRIYARFDYNNGKKELIFDHPVRGHKNNSKNAPKNVAMSNDISSSPAKSRR